MIVSLQNVSKNLDNLRKNENLKMQIAPTNVVSWVLRDPPIAFFFCAVTLSNDVLSNNVLLSNDVPRGRRYNGSSGRRGGVVAARVVTGSQSPTCHVFDGS